MSERAPKLAWQRAGRQRADGALCRSLPMEINTVAKINLGFLWEAFAIASGVPPSVWRAVPRDKGADIRPSENRVPYRSAQRTWDEARVKEVVPRGEHRISRVRNGLAASQEVKS